jgi:hypothetical protein
MKLTFALFVAMIATTFASPVLADTSNMEIVSKIHCQSDAELTFNGWSTNSKVETVGASIVRFIPHTTDPDRAVRQSTTRFGETTICVQTELLRTQS